MTAKLSAIHRTKVIARSVNVHVGAQRKDENSATLFLTGEELAMEVHLDRRGIDRLLLQLRTIGRVTAADIAQDVLRRVFDPESRKGVSKAA
jgi:hypothetical protein